MTWILAALSAPIGHAVWALARSSGEANGAPPVAIALAAALLELTLFAGLVGAVFAAARVNGARVAALDVVRPLALAQGPAALYLLGVVPAITHFTPLLLAVRVVTSVRAAMLAARLPLLLALVAVLVGAALGVFVGFAAAAAIYS